MEHLAGLLAKDLGRSLGLSEERVEVLRFGLEVVLGTALEFGAILIVAAVLGVFLPVAGALLAASLFRSLSGGAHFSSYQRCFASGLLVFPCFGILASVLYNVAAFRFPGIFAAIILLSYVFVYLWAPADHPNRPIRSLEERAKFRRLSFWLVSVWVVVIYSGVKLFPSSFWWGALFGILWQAATLSPAMYRVFFVLEKILNERRQRL